MKTIQRGIVLFVFLLTVFFANAATITWDGGGGDGQWNTAANWDVNLVPGASDDVILDNSVVAVNYIVTLPSGAVSVSVNTLTIIPTGLNIITLILPNTNTSVTGFTATGSGDAVVLNNRSIFINSSGSVTAGTPVSVTATGIFRINNGGRYVHNTERGHTNFLVANLSTSPGTENGIFEFDVPTTAAYSISAAGRTYGVLVLTATSSGGTKTYTVLSAASPMTVKGDFLINSNTNFTWSAVSDIILDGDLIQQSPSIFNLSTGTESPTFFIKGDINIQGDITQGGTGLPQIELNGAANQNVSVTGSISNSIEFEMNNAAGATLQTAVSLSYSLRLTNGIISTTATNLLTMIDNAVVPIASISSFVQGPMKKIGDDDFGFPIGEGGIFAPISIQNVSGQLPTDEFTAQYHRLNPQTNVGPLIQNPPLDHVSYVEYWTLDRNMGSIAVKIVGLAVNAVSFATDDLTLRVARYDGTTWVNEDRSGFIAGPLAPPYITGALFSIPVSNFSPFTIASTVAAPINPLPILFLSFTAQKNNSDGLLKWKLAETPAQNITFDIERSADGRNFRKIRSVNAINISEYRFTDFDLPAGTSYYRIKAKEPGGKMVVSAIAAIVNNENGIYITQIHPNPVKDMAKLKLVSAKASITEFIVSDITGRTVKQFRLAVPEGNSAFDINLGSLPGGSYFIRTFESGSGSSFARFIKQ